MAEKNKMQKVLEEAGKFVTKRKGDWNHATWEEFTQEIADLGYVMDFETCRNLGNVLEGAKYLYTTAPKARPAAKAKPRSKPRTKAKAKAKAKAKG